MCGLLAMQGFSTPNPHVVPGSTVLGCIVITELRVVL